jgi:predicted alpha/beta hydrolase family esterase
MRVSDLDILIIPGLGGSGPDHWQSRWAEKLSTARMIEQADWFAPNRDAWVAEILREIEASTRPVALVGHSLGSLAAAPSTTRRAQKSPSPFSSRRPTLKVPLRRQA